VDLAACVLRAWGLGADALIGAGLPVFLTAGFFAASWARLFAGAEGDTLGVALTAVFFAAAPGARWAFPPGFFTGFAALTALDVTLLASHRLRCRPACAKARLLQRRRRL